MFGIRLQGRGGQGAVVASKLLADAYFREGYNVQAFPAFGMERRGAPVAAYVRVAPNPIKERGQVRTPEVVVILDDSLLNMVDVTEGIKKGGMILLNSEREPDEVGLSGAFALATVDASRLAVEHGLGSVTAPIVNTVVLGAFARVRSDMRLPSILAAIKHGVPSQKEANLAAAQAAFDLVALAEKKHG